MSGGPAGATRSFFVLVPILDDWPNATAIVERLGEEFERNDWTGSVLIVDDGSSERAAPLPRRPGSLENVEILRLRRNLGHQRAICVGLCHLEQRARDLPVIVMDGDGQDLPSDLPSLARAFESVGDPGAVFAARAKRPEGGLFKLFYRCYRILHRLLTGRSIRVGNFSILSPRAISAVTSSPEAWSHYAAAVAQSRIPIATVDLDRAKRLTGPPRMNFVSLITHGLSAISVYADIVSVRLLIAGALATLIGGLVVAGVWLEQLIDPGPVPPAAIWLLVIGALVVVQINIGALLAGFLIHHGRRSASVVPRRDFTLFVESVTPWSSVAQPTEGGSPRAFS